MFVIPREVEYGRTDDDVGESIGEWHLLNEADPKISRRQSRRERCGQLAHMINTFRILVKREYLASFA